MQGEEATCRCPVARLGRCAWRQSANSGGSGNASRVSFDQASNVEHHVAACVDEAAAWICWRAQAVRPSGS